jgi:hypothetical protein
MGAAPSREKQSLEIACETGVVMLATQVLVDLHNAAEALVMIAENGRPFRMK